MRWLLAAVILLAAVEAGLAQDAGDPEAGYAYAAQNCTECHAIEPGDYESPLYEAPGFEEIANVPGMSEIALLSFFQTSHPSMPNLIVAPSDIRDLITYIRSLKD